MTHLIILNAELHNILRWKTKCIQT